MTGETYCIRDDSSNRVKIGRSVNAYRRFKQLQTGSSVPLKWVGAFEAGRYGERAFHRAYSDRRIKVRGRVTEWFDDSDHVVSENFSAIASNWSDGHILKIL